MCAGVTYDVRIPLGTSRGRRDWDEPGPACVGHHVGGTDPAAVRQAAPARDGHRAAHARGEQRTGATLGAVWLAALVLEIVNPSRGVTAFALGLLFPGGGFLFTGSWGLFAAALVVFLLALIVFAVMSPYWVPPLVLIAAATGAALDAGGGVHDAARLIVPLMLALVAGAGRGEPADPAAPLP